MLLISRTNQYQLHKLIFTAGTWSSIYGPLDLDQIHLNLARPMRKLPSRPCSWELLPYPIRSTLFAHGYIPPETERQQEDRQVNSPHIIALDLSLERNDQWSILLFTPFRSGRGAWLDMRRDKNLWTIWTIFHLRWKRQTEDKNQSIEANGQKKQACEFLSMMIMLAKQFSLSVMSLGYVSSRALPFSAILSLSLFSPHHYLYYFGWMICKCNSVYIYIYAYILLCIIPLN